MNIYYVYALYTYINTYKGESQVPYDPVPGLQVPTHHEEQGEPQL